jgi:hypothetical protein
VVAPGGLSLCDLLAPVWYSSLRKFLYAYMQNLKNTKNLPPKRLFKINKEYIVSKVPFSSYKFRSFYPLDS